MEQLNRLTTYNDISTKLALLSDHCLLELLEKAEYMGSGIGGIRSLLMMDDTHVFVKKIPLTDIERRSENRTSTANLFDLPLYYQYGIGSAGFGVWRELAAHVMTTNWVLTGECPHFPLMYHWRILSKVATSPSSNDLEDLERTVDYWGGSDAIRQRLKANQEAFACVVLFMEHFPENLHEWLGNEIAKGNKAIESAVSMVESNLTKIVSFMNSRGLLHFDAHFKNILTDGHQLYLTDFGLATCSQFDLTEEEHTFFERHRLYDYCYTMAHLVNSLISKMFSEENRNSILQEYINGERTIQLGSPIESIMKRYASVTVVMNEFMRKICTETKETPYPVNELKRALAEMEMDY